MGHDRICSLLDRAQEAAPLPSDTNRTLTRRTLTHRTLTRCTLTRHTFELAQLCQRVGYGNEEERASLTAGRRRQNRAIDSVAPRLR